MDFLQSANATPCRYPFTQHNIDIRALLDKKTSLIFGTRGESLKQMCVAIPRIYGQLKIHKANHPIRPVIAYYTDPLYKLAKFLACWFKQATNFAPAKATKNSIELAQDLKDRSFPPDSRLISMDAVSMYTRIPVRYTIDCTLNHLRRVNIQQDIINEFEKLITICTKDNVCHFLGRTYRFPDGLPMGAPLSALMAEVFMDHLEDQILSSNDPSVQNILFYKRYVDDILCVWNGDDDQLWHILDLFNDFHHSMEFTLEIGGTNINFLDLSLRLIPNGQHRQISFSVHRKDTYTGISIAHDSAHKMVTINHAIHRLIHLPLSAQAISEETQNIQLVANKNGLNLNIPLMIRKKRLRSLLSNINPQPQTGNPDHSRTKWIRLPYLDSCSNKISRELKRMDYKVGFYPLTTLNQLVNLKDPIPKMKRPRIYRLECGECSAQYIGQTGRPLSKRLGEHRSALPPRIQLWPNTAWSGITIFLKSILL